MGLFNQTEEEKLAKEKIKEEKAQQKLVAKQEKIKKFLEKKQKELDDKKIKYKEKYGLVDLNNLETAMVSVVASDLSSAHFAKPEVAQVNLLKALVDQNWILMNHLKEIEKRLENLENKN